MELRKTILLSILCLAGGISIGIKADVPPALNRLLEDERLPKTEKDVLLAELVLETFRDPKSPLYNDVIHKIGEAIPTRPRQAAEILRYLENFWQIHFLDDYLVCHVDVVAAQLDAGDTFRNMSLLGAGLVLAQSIQNYLPRYIAVTAVLLFPPSSARAGQFALNQIIDSSRCQNFIPPSPAQILSLQISTQDQGAALQLSQTQEQAENLSRAMITSYFSAGAQGLLLSGLFYLQSAIRTSSVASRGLGIYGLFAFGVLWSADSVVTSISNREHEATLRETSRQKTIQFLANDSSTVQDVAEFTGVIKSLTSFYSQSAFQARDDLSKRSQGFQSICNEKQPSWLSKSYLNSTPIVIPYSRIRDEIAGISESRRLVTSAYNCHARFEKYLILELLSRTRQARKDLGTISPNLMSGTAIEYAKTWAAQVADGPVSTGQKDSVRREISIFKAHMKAMTARGQLCKHGPSLLLQGLYALETKSERLTFVHQVELSAFFNTLVQIYLQSKDQQLQCPSQA